MNTIKNKIDVTPLLYVLLMIVVFLLGSCRSARPIIPAPKYSFELPTPVDTSFNYLDDEISVFLDNK